MPPPADRPLRTPTEQFEETARIHAREEQGAWLEFVNGRTRPKARTDGNRGIAVEWLTRGALAHRPELWLHPAQGLKAQPCRSDRVRADGALAPGEAFARQGEWVDPEPVLMVAEITAYDPETDRCSREEKPAVYAATGIPVYLLVDREARESIVRSRPRGARYAEVRTVPFGERLFLPSPVGMAFDTRRLKDCAPRPRASPYSAGPPRPAGECGGPVRGRWSVSAPPVPPPSPGAGRR
ncbi:Uma2 family endonuclease [Streptomyces sp. MspMP-M5]|uniref:Uma2 family endonuclease n=1 Tax=unclassified Streptomyces TaxID=2593676 RepID=UPI00036DB9D0|nr:Uma2 family endonuclease [Streptomyces sp. MspMP-M5]MYT31568.1 Uma2 family endonuclease [Streptomyces sp. SID8354]